MANVNLFGLHERARRSGRTACLGVATSKEEAQQQHQKGGAHTHACRHLLVHDTGMNRRSRPRFHCWAGKLALYHQGCAAAQDFLMRHAQRQRAVDITVALA